MRKYFIGVDIHKSTCSFHVLRSNGKFYKKITLPTYRANIVSFLKSLDGEIVMCIEEGSLSHWFYMTFVSFVKELHIHNARKSGRSFGVKNDEKDAKELADLLLFDRVEPIFHDFGKFGVLRDYLKVYNKLNSDVVRSKNRLKSAFSSLNIPCSGKSIYSPSNREEWLKKIPHRSSRESIQILFNQMDSSLEHKNQSNNLMIKEARRFSITRKLQTIPGIGDVFSAMLVAIIIDIRRFPNKYALLAYSGFKVISRGSGHNRINSEGIVKRIDAKNHTFGLDKKCNKSLKNIFKSASRNAVTYSPEFKAYEDAYIRNGHSESIAKVRSARKFVAIVYHIWKTGETYDPVKAFRTDEYDSKTD